MPRPSKSVELRHFWSFASVFHFYAFFSLQADILHATYGPVYCYYLFWIGLLENFLYNTLFHSKLDFYFKFSSSRNHLFLLDVFSFSIRKSCPSRDARTQLFSMHFSVFVLSLTKTFFFFPSPKSNPATTVLGVGFPHAALYTTLPLKQKHFRARNVIFLAHLPVLCTRIPLGKLLHPS